MKGGLESSEQTPSKEGFRHESMTVFRVRHGHTEYEEHSGRGESEINEDLTEEGIEAVKNSAKLISDRINPKEDIVYVVSSPRARTRHTAEIIKTYLKEAGIDVAVDEKREQQDRIVGSHLLDETGAPVPANTPEHADIWNEIQDGTQSDAEAAADVRRRYLNGEIPEIEAPESVRKRARDQLTYLTRIARKIQPKVEKRIVIIQVEHEETLTQLLEAASSGERSMNKETGAEKAEAFEMKIPTKAGEPMEVSSLEDPDRKFSVDFDPNKREFKP